MRGFPVFICYPKPRVLVKKDQSDHWGPSLEEINARTYDYVKLHRLSASFDIGLKSPFCMHASFNGAYLLPALPDLSPIENATNTFNRFFGQIVLGGIYYEAISPGEVDRGILYPIGYFRGFGGPHCLFAQIQATIQSRVASPIHTIELLNPKFIFSADIYSAYEIGKKFAQVVSNLSPELVLKGLSAFVGRAWSEALSNLWICVEQIISHIWSVNVLSAPGIDIPGRKEFLKDNRTWTTSTRIELLFNRGQIDSDTYALLNVARKSRNDLVHKGDWPSPSEVEAALDGVFRLLSSVVHGSPIYMNEVLGGFKKIGTPEANLPHKSPKPIPVEEMDGMWLGPIPPIPGEKEWGDKPFEKYYDDPNL